MSQNNGRAKGNRLREMEDGPEDQRINGDTHEGEDAGRAAGWAWGAGPRFKFAPMTSEQFAAATYKREWLVKRLLIKGRPTIWGGAYKTLKTSTLTDLAVSLGTATPFLGSFEVYRKVRVAFLSGETGEPTTQETAKRVCRARGCTLNSSGVLWQFSLPQLSDPEDLAELNAGLREHQAEVVIVDPAYLCMLSGHPNGGDPASNFFVVGPLLMNFSRACLDAGCTPIIAHHANRQLGDGQMMELRHLSYSGFAEFAAQWLLLSRKEPYRGDGKHRIWLNAGGRDGQSGQWILDADEGLMTDDFDSRRWEVAVTPAFEFIETQKQGRADQREAKREATLLGNCKRFMEAFDRLTKKGGGVVPVEDVRNLANLSGDVTKRVVARLVCDGTLAETTAPKASGRGLKAISPVKAVRRAEPFEGGGEG